MADMDEERGALVSRVAANIRQRIEDGQWAVQLPGVRVLCSEVGGSRQTMMLALRLLEKEGVLSEAAPGKPRKILLEKGSVKRSQLRVAVITRSKKEELLSLDQEVLACLEAGLRQRGYAYSLVVFWDINRVSGVDGIGELLERNPADLYVVMGVHIECSRWLIKRGVPAVYIGGSVNVKKAPQVGFNHQGMWTQAFETLVAKGHRRIVTLLPEYLQGDGGELSLTEQRILKAFAECGMESSLYHIPRWEGTSESCYTILGKTFGLTAPTALIVDSVGQIPAVLSFLLRNKLRYPEDVSLISLDADSQLSEYYPAISCVERSAKELAGKVVSCVNDYFLSVDGSREGFHAAPTVFHLTDSVAAPKKAY